MNKVQVVHNVELRETIAVVSPNLDEVLSCLKTGKLSVMYAETKCHTKDTFKKKEGFKIVNERLAAASYEDWEITAFRTLGTMVRVTLNKGKRTISFVGRTDKPLLRMKKNRGY